MSKAPDLGSSMLLLVLDSCLVSTPELMWVSRSLGMLITTESRGLPCASSARQEPWMECPNISAIVHDCPAEASDG